VAIRRLGYLKRPEQREQSTGERKRGRGIGIKNLENLLCFYFFSLFFYRESDSLTYWNHFIVLIPVIAVFVFCTFSRKFVDYSEFPLLMLSIMMVVQYLYFAYQSPLNLSFLVSLIFVPPPPPISNFYRFFYILFFFDCAKLYPLFVFYLLPLCYTHATFISTAAFLGYGVIICTMPTTGSLHLSTKSVCSSHTLFFRFCPKYRNMPKKEILPKKERKFKKRNKTSGEEREAW
jgi:hypothetical protein